MTLWTDGILAFLSAIGVVTIIWCISGIVFRRNRMRLPVTLLLSVEGSGENMDYMLSCLEEGRRRVGNHAVIILLDMGLDAEGRSRAKRLCRDHRATVLISPQKLAEHLQQWEKEDDYG